MIDIPEQVINYFGALNLPAFWSLPRIMEEDSSLGELVRQMVRRVDEILRSDLRGKPSWVTGVQFLPQRSRTIMAMHYLILEAVAKKRLSILARDYESEPMWPYNHPDLSRVKPNANGLVALSSFDTSTGGLRIESTVFEILPSIAGVMNSMYWTNRVLFQLSGKFTILVRLDPLMMQSASEYKSPMYKMWVYGKTLDWHDIDHLTEERHVRWMPDLGWQKDVGEYFGTSDA